MVSLACVSAQILENHLTLERHPCPQWLRSAEEAPIFTLCSRTDELLKFCDGLEIIVCALSESRALRVRIISGQRRPSIFRCASCLLNRPNIGDENHQFFLGLKEEISCGKALVSTVAREPAARPPSLVKNPCTSRAMRQTYRLASSTSRPVSRLQNSVALPLGLHSRSAWANRP